MAGGSLERVEDARSLLCQLRWHLTPVSAQMAPSRAEAGSNNYAGGAPCPPIVAPQSRDSSLESHPHPPFRAMTLGLSTGVLSTTTTKSSWRWQLRA